MLPLACCRSARTTCLGDVICCMVGTDVAGSAMAYAKWSAGKCTAARDLPHSLLLERLSSVLLVSHCRCRNQFACCLAARRYKPEFHQCGRRCARRCVRCNARLTVRACRTCNVVHCHMISVSWMTFMVPSVLAPSHHIALTILPQSRALVGVRAVIIWE